MSPHPGNQDGAWSPWGDRLVATLALGLTIGLLWAWIGTFYLGQPINEILAFDVEDTDLLGGEATKRTILGKHAFGDFQAPVVWATQILAGSYPVPSPPYLPTSFVYGAIFVYASPMLAVSAHQILTLGATSIAAGLLLRGLSISRRIIIIFFAVILTVPMIATLDSGNLQGLTIAFFMLALVFLQRQKSAPAWILIGIAIAFKGYPVLALAWPLAAGWWRFAARALLVMVGLTLTWFALLPGGLGLNLGRYLEGLTERSSQGMLDAESSLAGFTAKTAGIFAGADVMGTLATSELWSLGCFVVWVGLVLLLAWTRRLPQWAIALLSLSTLQMAVPTSYNYSLGWASIAAIWFGMGTLFSDQSLPDEQSVRGIHESAVLRWSALAAIAATLVPLGYRFAYNDVVINVSTLMSPALLVLFMGIAAFSAFRKGGFGELSGTSGPRKPGS